ncbi:hypothetical protein DJ078_23010 [Salmonella enterica]|nr:hypothetical protein [Salmonella enterica]
MTQQDERNLTRNLLKGVYLFRRTAFLVAFLYFIGAGFKAKVEYMNLPSLLYILSAKQGSFNV